MKKVLSLLMGFVLSTAVLAHAPLLSVDDNEDGSIYVECGFSNGASAGGIEFLLVEDKPYNGSEDAFEGKRILYKGTLGEDGSAEIVKPNVVAYQVVFNAGPGHIVGKKGPKLTHEEKENWNNLFEEADLGQWKDKVEGN
ncbi:hypothetical protein [Fusobacterium sp. MFO224]|uniref:hypothetical protein n=1 Tax=Fusobacterium sp. MFO224 TaxID=3378070 RepID=UPI003852C33A